MRSVDEKLSFLRSVLGKPESSSDGDNYSFVCPSCAKNNSRKKKLVIKISDGIYHCWVCDLRGRNLLSLFKKYFPAYYEKASGIFKKNGNSTYTVQQNNEFQESITLAPGFKLLGFKSLMDDPDVIAVRNYVLRRGLRISDMWRYKLGTYTSGRFRRRVIIPSFNVDGKLNYFVARAIDVDCKRRYLNPKAERKNFVFNELNIDWKKELTIVEGPFDLMKAGENCTCILGSYCDESYELFKKIVKNMTPICLALDPDAKQKMHDIAQVFASYNIPVRIVDIAGYGDVGEMPKLEFQKRKQKALPWSANDRLLNLFGKIKSGSLL